MDAFEDDEKIETEIKSLCRKDKPQRVRFRNCFVTLFVKNNQYIIDVSELAKNGTVTYCCRSPLEKAPSTGALHYHYYVEFDAKKSMRQIKELFRNNTINIQKRQGNAQEARLYCTRDYYSKKHKMKKDQYTCVHPEETITEAGKLSAPGTRSDWEAIYEACKDLKRSIRSILDEFPKHAVRHEKRIRECRASVRRDFWCGQKFEREVIVRYGDAGTGKDYDVYEKYGAENIYEMTRDENGAVWWDGYEGQDVLLISDFKWWLTRARLLNICGSRMVRANIKGATEWFTGTKVIITSNFPIEQWYSNWDDTGVVDPAFVSRLTAVEKYEMEEEAEPVDYSILKPVLVKKPNWRARAKAKLRKKNKKRKKRGGGIVLPPTSGPLEKNKILPKEKKQEVWAAVLEYGGASGGSKS